MGSAANSNNGTESVSGLSKDMDGMEGSEDLSVEQEELIVMDALFGIMGEYGNNLMIYSSDSIILKHQI